MTRVTGQPVDRIMRSYVEQPGAPVLSVRDASARARNSEIASAQERFVGTPGRVRRRRRRGRCRCASRPPTGQPRCEVIDRREQTFTADGCAQRVRQCRQPRLLLHRVHAGRPCARCRPARPGSKPVERISLLGDEWWMVRGGPPRHRRLSRPRGAVWPATTPRRSPKRSRRGSTFIAASIVGRRRAAAALTRRGFATGSARR